MRPKVAPVGTDRRETMAVAMVSRGNGEGRAVTRICGHIAVRSPSLVAGQARQHLSFHRQHQLVDGASIQGQKGTWPAIRHIYGQVVQPLNPGAEPEASGLISRDSLH
jgi:hypothetical protein